MKKLDIQTNPSGAHKLRISLNLGKKYKRKRMSIGLGTHDYIEAQARGLLLLNFAKRLGLYDREVPEEPEKQGPEIVNDLPLFDDKNIHKS
ncbi:hypothetical protein [Akkermansia muciniphila]|uniref:hypothetical protein n=1 Tax=Akkermansia muciniphila TaxID=239935 RepID=UPI0029E80448|nr:hypothetical protein [Akkermansia muciniphila]WPK65516.1 hypothetical protein SBL66_04425 [Akkermansia muciniphila]